jgi:hypothetical protein
MKYIIDYMALCEYRSGNVQILLNRSYKSMYIEWWLHNIGYYLTLPLSFIPYFKSINERCRDVDLEEWPIEKSYFKR